MFLVFYIDGFSYFWSELCSSWVWVKKFSSFFVFAYFMVRKCLFLIKKLMSIFHADCWCSGFYPFTCSGKIIFHWYTHAKLNNLCIISLFISFFWFLDCVFHFELSWVDWAVLFSCFSWYPFYMVVRLSQRAAAHAIDKLVGPNTKAVKIG